jgi:TonB family protein
MSKVGGHLKGILAIQIICNCLSPCRVLAQQPNMDSPAMSEASALAEESAAHLIKRVEPIYPPLARLTRVEGLVRIDLLVGRDGKVLDCHVISGHPLLVQSAVDAVRKWEYKPFVREGEPTLVRTEADLKFSLPEIHPHPEVPFPEVSDLRSIVITFASMGCMGRCPVYELRISGDGKVTYKGMSNVFLTGTHSGRISEAEFRNLVGAFRTADFYSLEDDYTVGMMDGWAGEASITIGSQSKTVRYDESPKVMEQVQLEILSASGTERWVKGNAASVPSMLSEPLDVLKPQAGGSSYLVSAATQGDISVVEALLRAGSAVNSKNKLGQSALMLASIRGLPTMVELLLRAGGDPNSVNQNGETVLIHGAASGNAAVLRHLLKAGASVNARSKDGNTALIEAAVTGNPELVAILLRAGARVNLRGANRTTALIAGSTGELNGGVRDIFLTPYAEIPDEVIDRAKVVRLLIDAGADINAVNDEGENALFTVNDETVRELIKTKININIRNKDGETPLIATVASEVAELLVSAGAELNLTDPQGRTALMHGAENNYVENLKVLTRAGARLDLQDNSGSTALMLCAEKGLENSVKVLIDAHANVNIRDHEKFTALVRLRRSRGHDINAAEKLLLAAGGTE